MRSAIIAFFLASVASAVDPTALQVMIPQEMKIEQAAHHNHAERDYLGHYEPPCEDDETLFQIQGIPGEVCSAKCTDFLPCPTDVPEGVTATPMCALKDGATGNKYCVLICRPEKGLRGSDDDQCGDATCQVIQDGIGVCTYE